jgi:pseudouridylate synthase
MKYSPEVRAAFDTGQPVVALESTIISHGMPYPGNLQVASEVEAAIRSGGAVPATIAIIGGEFHVGLSADELNYFASANGIMKCSRRDLPFVASRKLNGATTVAATMIIAEMAGIRIFATGGIGGVHRNAETTFDISADLHEFAVTNVAVVSAGAKAILDLAKTLEFLETLGVPVIGFGTDEFPAFYTRSSGQRLGLRLDNATQVAQFLRHKSSLKLTGGVLIANPIPAAYELDSMEIESAIVQSLSDAQAQAIEGKEVTPFLLKRLNEITNGRSQQANRELVLNNARVAAAIAVALNEL